MLVVPIPAGDARPMGPLPFSEVAVSLVAMTSLCSLAGYLLTHYRPALLLKFVQLLRPEELRDEAWEEAKLGAVAPQEDSGAVNAAEEGEGDEQKRRPQLRKRNAAELLFIFVHNMAVTVMAAVAWMLGWPSLALHAFSLEVGYEIFDTLSLGMKRMEPETLLHHIVSPICILCSTQTDVDFRVLCHLCICIDLSGAILGYCKFLLRYSHQSASLIYQRLFWIYLPLRVILPLIDTAIIVSREVSKRGGLLPMRHLTGTDHIAGLGRTDWTQLYFWAMAVLNAFNLYFCLVIRARARLPANLVARWEARTGCR